MIGWTDGWIVLIRFHPPSPLHPPTIGIGFYSVQSKKTIAVITRNLIQYLFTRFLSFFGCTFSLSPFDCARFLHLFVRTQLQATTQHTTNVPVDHQRKTTLSLTPHPWRSVLVCPNNSTVVCDPFSSLSRARAFSLPGKVRSPFVNEITLS